jgi:hypothetical protein
MLKKEWKMGQIFEAFSEYLNFKGAFIGLLVKPQIHTKSPIEIVSPHCKNFMH